MRITTYRARYHGELHLIVRLEPVYPAALVHLQLYDFVSEEGVAQNLLMASVVVAVVPVVVLFTFVQRYLTEGLLSGATKG